MAVGRLSLRYMLNMGPWGRAGWVPGIAPPSTHRIPIPRVHPPHPRYTQHVNAGYVTARNGVVGLISVDQLTLDALFSGLRGITEVYNLVKAHNR